MYQFFVQPHHSFKLPVQAFFHFGEKWRNYRRSVELLKIEGWQFFQLSGPYKDRPDHTAAYKEFASNVETIIQADVDTYITKIVKKKNDS